MTRRILVPAGHREAVASAVRSAAAVRRRRREDAESMPPRWKLEAYQKPPTATEWDTWGMLGGRGSGKTFAGSSYVLEHLRKYGKDANVGVGGATNGDVRAIAAEDPKSGLITLGGLFGKDAVHEFVSYKKSIPMEAVHVGGGHVTFIGADEPDRLRGYNFSLFWGDEIASWPAESWDNAVFCTRSGPALMIFTTTPKPRPFLKELLKDAGTIVVTATTYDNPHLPERQRRRLKRRYEGTRVGRQELYAELLADVEGAWWHSECDMAGPEGSCSKESGHLEGLRVATIPLRPSLNGDDEEARELAIQRAVVAVDPAGTRNDKSDYTGLVTAAMGDDGDWYVITSEALKVSPHTWAERACDLLDEIDGERIVAERNHGGEMVEETIRNVRDNVSLKTIHASRGKATRAEPIAALFEQGRVHMVGVHGDLEAQLCGFPSPDLENDDILDAMVYALTELEGGGGWILG